MRVFFFTSPLLKSQFPLIYKPANIGLPSSVSFDYNWFIITREVTSSGQILEINMIPDTPNIGVNSRVKPTYIFTI